MHIHFLSVLRAIPLGDERLVCIE